MQRDDRIPRPEPVLMSRADRIAQFGIDCNDVHWRGWEPGGDIVKRLVLRNVSTDVQKLTYTMPSTRFFFLDFPELITLSPGMTFSITIHFRPIRRQSYLDWMQFTNATGDSFFVSVKATLPVMELQVPQHLDFGFCPVADRSTQTFQLDNCGEVPTTFTWDVPAPFTIEPKSGSIDKGESLTMTVHFDPEAATVVEAKCICRADAGNQYAVTLVAASKHPYLAASQTHIDFGEVLAGRKVERYFTLTNVTVTWTVFTFKKLTEDVKTTSNVFFFSPQNALVAPGQTVKVKVTYTPKTTGTFSTDEFAFVTPADIASGNPGVVVTTAGTATGPHVVADKSVLEFGDAKPGQTVTREFTLVNRTDTAAPFYVFRDSAGSFRFSVTKGVVPPLLSVIIKVTFRPSTPMNFYRRIFIGVQGQQPVFIDLIGTCWEGKQRPARLTNRFVRAYHERCQVGLRRVDPETLLQTVYDLEEKGVLPLAEDKFVMVPAYEQFMASNGNEPELEASIEPSQLNFGFAAYGRNPEKRTVMIRNNSKGKLTCIWDLPAVNKGKGPPLFSVSPMVQDVAVGSSVEFIVTFVPNRENFYYFQDISCNVFYKANRSFRLVHEMTFSPPISLHVQAAGHTFSPHVEHFLPREKFSLTRVDFPPCQFGQKTFVTFKLSNKGDTPLSFNLGNGADDLDVFRIRPSMGMIKRNSFVLLMCEFSPPSHMPMLTENGERSGQDALSHTFHHEFKCTLNCSKIDILSFYGAAYAPTVSIENDGRLVFKPTSLGLQSVRKLGISNTSRIPVIYDWQVPEEYQSVLVVSPQSGVLRGHERCQMRWTFRPEAQKHYSFRVTCVVYATQWNEAGTELVPDPSNVQEMSLSVKGECSAGMLRFEPAAIDFKTIQVNDISYRKFVLRNEGDSTVDYRIDVECLTPDCFSKEDFAVNLEFEKASARASSRLNTPGSVITSTGEFMQPFAPMLEFDHPEGTIPARGHREITVRLIPRYTMHHKFLAKLRCNSQSSKAQDDGDSKDTILEISAVGGCPEILIRDFRLRHGLDYRLMDRNAVRAQLSIDEINHELHRPLRELETKLHVNPFETKAFTTKELSRLLYVYDISFGMSEVDSGPSVAFFLLQNTSNLAVKWETRFPEDVEVSMAKWVDVGDPDKETRWHQNILDRGIFSVEPRRGALEIGESVVVKMFYHHEFVGRHQLPITFQVNRGKHVSLVLTGETVNTMPPVVDLHSCSVLAPVEKGPASSVLTYGQRVMPYDWLLNTPRHFKLQSVPLGLEIGESPVQLFPLYNHSQWELEYELDLGALHACKEDNFGMHIFCCLNPKGAIPPNGMINLQWVFRPVQVKSYAVSIPVHVVGSRLASQEIVLHGFGCNYWPHADRPFVVHRNDGNLAQKTEPQYFSFKSIAPKHQVMIPPGQFTRLGLDSVDFGDAPLHSVSHQIVTLSNLNQQRGVYFRWVNTPGGGAFQTDRAMRKIIPDRGATGARFLYLNNPSWSVSVQPAEGYLEPGEDIVLRVTLEGGAQPALVNHSIQCECSYYSFNAVEEDTSGVPLDAASSSESSDGDDSDDSDDSVSDLKFMSKKPKTTKRVRIVDPVTGKRGYAKSALHQKMANRASVVTSRRPEHARSVAIKENEFKEIPVMAQSLAERTVSRGGVDLHESGIISTNTSAHGIRDEFDAMLMKSMEGMNALDANLTATQADGTPTLTAPNGAAFVAQLEQSDLCVLDLGLTARLLSFTQLEELHKKKSGVEEAMVVADEAENSHIPSNEPPSLNLQERSDVLELNQDNGYAPVNFFVPHKMEVKDGDEAVQQLDASKSGVVGHVMQSLLRDVLTDSKIVGSFAELQKEEIPLFADLLEASEEQQNNMNATLERQLSQNSAIQAPMGEQLRVCENVVVETLFNLMSEAAQGHFDLSHIPKHIVTEGLTFEEGSE